MRDRLDTSTTAGGSTRAGEDGGNREAVDIRKLNVEQHEVGAQLTARADRLGPVGGLPHDQEPVRRQDLARDRSEGRMIVDDQYPGGPDRILVRCEAGGFRVFRGTERFVVGRWPAASHTGCRGESHQVRARLPEPCRDRLVVAASG